jgi:hypothetical protein
MSSAPALAIDRVERIAPRAQEQPDRRRRPGRPFPELDEDGEREDEPSAPPAPARTPRAGDLDDDEPHTIDVRVRGRLPTRQILPACTGAALAL